MTRLQKIVLSSSRDIPFNKLVLNWNNLARIIFESFAGLGLKASGTGFTVQDLLRPGRVAQTGLDAGRPLLDSISNLMGWSPSSRTSSRSPACCLPGR